VDYNRRKTFPAIPATHYGIYDRLHAQGYPKLTHQELDMRDRIARETLVRSHRFDLIFLCSAQPSEGATFLSSWTLK
jgi:hypothetical protein